jgi:hypothetical protein
MVSILGAYGEVRSGSHIRGLGPSNLPLDACDTDFLASLLVVVEPFVFGKVNSGKFGARLCSRRKELALSLRQNSCTLIFELLADQPRP